ncbi:MAG: 4-hydroxy-3-methylbut-2-enyl diphosphate reductase [Rickettsiales bacterium]|jgi:4-hydroxy-3-methylbut-2-enyl diphosphate reductase|nr:4-hydroxy-3-methylbut-2-enyl diphosphate reductase [Rickettsiales bacterium]
MQTDNKSKKRIPATLELVSPRGFCAGVERAIRVVEQALATHGAPVYVLGGIVHNELVIGRLAEKGVVFVKSLDAADAAKPLILPAHGVAKDVEAAARKRHAVVIDATCPLVLNVHSDLKRLEQMGAEIIVIGDPKHDEVIATRGQIDGPSICIRKIGDLDASGLAFDAKIGVISQTTLNADYVLDLCGQLAEKFPNMIKFDGRPMGNICNVTKKRQAAMRAAAKGSDLAVVFGSATSSNSVELCREARNSGAKNAILILDKSQMDWSLVGPGSRVVATAGASTPEDLVQDWAAEFRRRFAQGGHTR